MPHITLEISANLGDLADAMLDSVTNVCQRSGHFDNAVIMSRAVVHERYQVRQQGMSAFVNTAMRIRAGRTREIKSALNAEIARSIKTLLDDRLISIPTCITCEIGEVDTQTRALIIHGES